MKASLFLLQFWLQNQTRWIRHHLAHEGFLSLCFLGIVSLWIYMLQDFVHHKIGTDPMLRSKVAEGFTYAIFGMVGLFLSRCTRQLESEASWRFHMDNGGLPATAQKTKWLLFSLLYGSTSFLAVIICARWLVSQSLLTWVLLSFGSMGIGYGLSRRFAPSSRCSTSPIYIPSSTRGAIVWSFVRPIFFPYGSEKLVVLLLLGMGNLYLVYYQMPAFVCILYTFLLAFIPVGVLAKQLSRNLDWYGLNVESVLPIHTYLQAIYWTAGGIGLVGGFMTLFGWWAGMWSVGGAFSIEMSVLIMGVYVAPLWVLATCWLQLDPRRPSLAFLISLLVGLLFASALYATHWAWIGFPLLYRYGTVSQVGRRMK